MPPRKYEQRLRAEGARATRRRIIDAVYEELRRAPDRPVSMDRIAQAAGVARPTVYLVFGSRAGLFDAVGADLLHSGGLFERMIDAAGHPDAREGLRGGVGGVVAMYAAHRDVLRALSSMAQLDAEAVGGAVRRMEEGRAGGMAELARRLGEQGLLRADTDVEQATDLLWLLTAFDSFDLLYTGRGATEERVAATLVATAERALCAVA
ncbi:TetR family transcriptional regulator [Streptomyces sp. 3MP-14]|uniref:TetR family transcriptional regulator n=1 Tax=Streptomyces mimosae TaxID=2586635 RepID=A0A5N6A4R0_9ACTN|nr:MULTISPECIES: TetR/AcrR family transcriptional regulator [Streptomyces]KAB8163777.1 TetR family transcriptional regulator [Streptomyces mimosae]KAB8175220.1 TetR family transcriptional regulator [Streptomyces sp. 3MP-14]